MRHATRYIWLIITALCVLASCSYQSTEHNNKWTLTQSQRDSIAFSTYHHYNVGYNFLCIADSMLLGSHPEGTDLKLDYPHEDVYLYEDDDFVVTEIFRNPNVTKTSIDSIWLCVGSDGIPLGWISEYDLHHNSTPVDPISRFMAFCGNLRDKLLSGWIGKNFIIFLLIYLILIQIKKQNLILIKQTERSIYTYLFWFSAVSAGTIYATIKCLTPEMWEEFYYHPSLNPVGQPPMIALYLSLMWLNIIFYIAIFFDLKDRVSLGKTLLIMTLAAIIGICFYICLAALKEIFLIYGIYIILVAALAAFVWNYLESKKKCKQKSQ
ncbi:MAG: hypothetical protein IJT90_05765 [Bacteroidaceae bacterium]|nr:hypothetical protein [Bacteroidaceae bacterium]